MNTATQDQVAKVLLTCGTEAQQREALLYAFGLLPKEQSLGSNWFLSAAPLEDGWYWRKEIDSPISPIIVKVVTGIMVDICETKDGTPYIAPNCDFQDYWFNGPIEVPVNDKIEHWDCRGI